MGREIIKSNEEESPKEINNLKIMKIQKEKEMKISKISMDLKKLNENC